MLKIRDINYIFTSREILFLWTIFFGVIITTLLDILSFATIIPIFQIIFLNKIPEINFFHYFFPNYNFNFNSKILLLLCFIIIFSLKNILIIFFNYFFINVFQKINIRISKDLFSLFLNQEYYFFLKSSSENFLQKITNDINYLNTWLVSLINYFTEIIFVIGVSILLIITNTKIFLFSFFIFLIVNIFYVYFFKNRLKRWSLSYRQSTGRVQDIIAEGVRGFKDVIVYNLSDRFLNNFSRNVSIANYSQARITFLNNISKYWLEIVGVLSMSAALLYFVFANSDISKLIPIFGLFVVVTFRLLSSFSRIILHGQNLKFYFPSVMSVSNEFKVLSNKKNINFNNNFVYEKLIELKNVSFSYLNNENKILKNINVTFNKGECIGVVGKNGSGKSTFLNLLSGLIKPTQGEIIIDNLYDLYSNRIKWNEKLSYVQQNIFLLDSSIKDNITLVTDDSEFNYIQYNHVLSILKLEVFFNDFPDKLNTKVGIDGISLSGGQKQLISLARALYKNSDVLIFDEPTSAFDITKMELFRELLLSFKRKKTIFLVTHNKDLFFNIFDKCIEINSGEIKIL
jgi:ABC-type multidrug transport system fused ATPase/permease subunit